MPGVIGKVGSIFGKHRVNIAQMSVGRATDKPGGDAIGVLNLDNEPPPAALDEIGQAPEHHQRARDPPAPGGANASVDGVSRDERRLR